MKTINNFIIEKLKISSTSKVRIFKYFPKDKDELKTIISNLIKERGNNADLNDIDTSKIYDMSNLFHIKEKDEIYNIKINEWNVSHVENMENMFLECGNFNSDLSNWDVSHVKNMSGMFYKCAKFNCDLSKWNVSKVNNMEDMFLGCKKFNQDLSSWDVSNVEEMDQMFRSCETFECKGLSKWNIKKCKYMPYMFYNCVSFIENIENWDIHEDVDTEKMFEKCKRLYKKPIWYGD